MHSMHVNFSWKLFLTALVAVIVTGCSTRATAPPPEQPQVSPSSSPSASPVEQADLWETWRLHSGKTTADVDTINASYGISRSWTATPEVTQRGYPIIGLSKDESCVVLFSEIIGGNIKWPMAIVMLPRYQPRGTEPVNALQAKANDVQNARALIGRMGDRLGCGMPA